MPTVIPFHRAVVDDPAFVGNPDPRCGTFDVYTTWIETEFDNQIAPYAGDVAEADEPDEPPDAWSSRSAASASRSSCPAGLGGPVDRRRCREEAQAGRRQEGRRRRQRRRGHRPMQGTIVKVVVEEGQAVAEGDTVVVIEAMKMEQPLKAHKAGTVTGLQAEVGATVTSGAVICEIKD